MNKQFLVCLVFTIFFYGACNKDSRKSSTEQKLTKGTYGFDSDFLRTHTRKIVELHGEGNAKVLLSADYQGRVMTSTASGDSGTSFGWINYALIASGEKKKQFNPVGGEERFWLGPEGGQYSIFFSKGDSFDIANWKVPGIIDTVDFDVVKEEKEQAVFVKKASLTNYSGTVFNIAIIRKIALLRKSDIEKSFNYEVPDAVSFVGYETINSIQNIGPSDWKKENGLISIWLLCMMTPSPHTKVIIPFNPQKDARVHITDNYFGQVPAERLIVKDSVIYFTCDGKYRSKLGLAPAIAKNMVASFDFKNNVLTIVLLQVDKKGMYVNSKWELQDQPYKGDVVNAYNDGPLEDGSQLGPFYEIESSSAVTELREGQTQVHKQITCHFEGDYYALRDIAKKLLGVDLDDVKK